MRYSVIENGRQVVVTEDSRGIIRVRRVNGRLLRFAWAADGRACYLVELQGNIEMYFSEECEILGSREIGDGWKEYQYIPDKSFQEYALRLYRAGGW